MKRGFLIGLLCLAIFSMSFKTAPARPAVAPQQGPRLWTCFKAVTPASWLGSTSYAANGTNPTLLLRKAGGGAKTQVLRLDISQDSPVAGGLIYCEVKLDRVDRYSAGGNLWLIRAKDTIVPAATQPEFTIYDGATATAENAGGADPRTIFSGTIFQTVTGLGTGFVLDFQADDRLNGTGSVLIYLYASTTAPTWRGTLTVLE